MVYHRVFLFAVLVGLSCVIFSVSGTHWPIGPKHYKERPKLSSFCSEAKEQFCPNGSAIPSFDDKDTVQLYELRAPIKERDVNLEIHRVAVRLKSEKTGDNHIMEWYGLSQLYNCTFPHISKDNKTAPPTWCNQGAICTTPGIDDVWHSKKSTSTYVGHLSGKEFKNLTKFITDYNETLPFYYTWRVGNSSKTARGFKEWFIPSDEARFVQQFYSEVVKVGGTIHNTSLPNCTYITLVSEEPVSLGNITTIFATNQELAQDILKFYKSVQAVNSPYSFFEGFSRVVDYVTLQKKFYLYYDDNYWQLRLHYPYISISNEPSPL